MGEYEKIYEKASLFQKHTMALGDHSCFNNVYSDDLCLGLP